jgi:hypothetical protein
MFQSVVTALLEDPKKTYNFAEVKFIKMYWLTCTSAEKASFKKVLQNGQFNIVNGGFSAPDEATTTADSIIDNFQAGH